MKKKPQLNQRSKPQQVRSEATVEAILSAAAQILERLKLDRMTTNKIAERAGVSVGSLYQFFPNKEALVSSLIDRQVEKNILRVQAAIDETRSMNLAEMTAHVVRQAFLAQTEHRSFLRALFVHVPLFGKVEFIVRSRNRFCQVLEAEFRRRQSEIRIETLDSAAFILVHAMMGVVEAVIFGEENTFDDETLIQQMTDLFQSYLRKVPKVPDPLAK